MDTISINGRKIGPGYPPYIIGEMSGNHNGDINRAFELLQAAKDAGVDAVKIQTYTADTLTLDHDGDDFLIKTGPWEGRKLYELYEEAHTPWAWHAALFEKARELGLTLFSTPFDETAVDFLEDLKAPAHKVASFEMMDPVLLRKVAKTGKPLIISTGMSNLQDIEFAIGTVRKAGAKDIVLLHCVSGYPSDPKESNIKTIPHLSETFDVLTGLSDHTHGTAVPVASIALGAHVIEKHYTLRRADGGPDSSFSLEPDELAALVRDTKTAWEALGEVNYERTEGEEDSLVFRRSLYVVEKMKKGDVFTSNNLRSIRPGYGLSPQYIDRILGRTCLCDLEVATAMKFDFVEGGEGSND